MGLDQAGAVEVEGRASIYADRAHRVYWGLTGASEVSVINKGEDGEAIANRRRDPRQLWMIGFRCLLGTAGGEGGVEYRNQG